jgi:hypothetical protein
MQTQTIVIIVAAFLVIAVVIGVLIYEYKENGGGGDNSKSSAVTDVRLVTFQTGDSEGTTWGFIWDAPTVGCCDGYKMTYTGTITSDDPKFHQSFTTHDTDPNQGRAVAINMDPKKYVPGTYTITITPSNQIGAGPSSQGSGTIPNCYVNANEFNQITKFGANVVGLLLQPTDGTSICGYSNSNPQPCSAPGPCIQMSISMTLNGAVLEDANGPIKNRPMPWGTSYDNLNIGFAFVSTTLKQTLKVGDNILYTIVADSNTGGYPSVITGGIQISGVKPGAVGNIRFVNNA